MYLNGEFGSKPEDVNAYAASSFFAVDRYASYRKYWKASLENGEWVVADRYTTSNMIYQVTKLPRLALDFADTLLLMKEGRVVSRCLADGFSTRMLDEIYDVDVAAYMRRVLARWQG